MRKTAMEYVVVVERAEDGSFSAFVPDLPGCVTCGDTVEEVRALIGEAVSAHVVSLRSHGEPVPLPAAKTFLVKAA
jgi:predicted RNase H-like HicB family nuclease